MPPSDATTMVPTLCLAVLSGLTLAWTAQSSQMKTVFNQICKQIAKCASVFHWVFHRSQHCSCLRPLVEWNFSVTLTMLIYLIEPLQSIQMVDNLHSPLQPMGFNPTRRSLHQPVVIELYSPLTLDSQISKFKFTCASYYSVKLRLENDLV